MSLSDEDKEKQKKFLASLPDVNCDKVLIALDVRYGIMDPYFFDKAKPDKNGIYSNVRLMQTQFESLKEMLNTFKEKPSIFTNKYVVAFKPVSDKWRWILVRKIEINKDNYEKYHSLL